MKWKDYGQMLLINRSLKQNFFMLDDIILTYIKAQNRGVTYQEVCESLSEKTGIDLEECQKNAIGVLNVLISLRQIQANEDGTYEVRQDAPSSLSPLNDGIGSTDLGK